MSDNNGFNQENGGYNQNNNNGNFNNGNNGNNGMKRLFKSKTNRVFCGVCGGLGEYFNVDPTLIRLAWVIFACCGGAGLIAYIIAALCIPEMK